MNKHPDYKSNRNIVYSCKYHVVWCPKYRRPVIQGAIEQRLKELIAQTCKNTRSELLELETMPDHVHLLVEVDPQFGFNQLIQRIKGKTSRLLRQEFPLLKNMPGLWTNSYFLSTVGGAPLEIVKQYIEQQKHG